MQNAKSLPFLFLALPVALTVGELALEVIPAAVEVADRVEVAVPREDPMGLQEGLVRAGLREARAVRARVLDRSQLLAPHGPVTTMAPQTQDTIPARAALGVVAAVP